MEGNQILKTRMAEVGLTQAELAEAVNADLRRAGYGGTVSDRTVRNWLTGKTRWPHHRQRDALSEVFDCSITELGFVAPVEREDVPRRRFIGTSAATVMAAAGASVQRAALPRVGAGDVERLLSKFALVVASDHQYGGKLTIETQASALAGEALSLQSRGTASQHSERALRLRGVVHVECDVGRDRRSPVRYRATTF